MNKPDIGFDAASVLLPDFNVVDGTKWAVVACDQYTSEPQYWEAVNQYADGALSTLQMILPEVYLAEADARVPQINAAMTDILNRHLHTYPHAMICISRTQSDGRIRKGLIGKVDLECYDYSADAKSLIRATEGTVLERIPPRVAIRRNAPLELPHVMLMIDDPTRSVIEPMVTRCAARQPLYDFDLMLGGGHICAHLLQKEEQTEVLSALAALISPDAMEARYGNAALAPLLFAVGDGNHSLATAKATYEEIKAAIGVEAALAHPARYALVEVVNLHDEALEFEPIYRAVFGADAQNLLSEWESYTQSLQGSAAAQSIRVITPDGEHCHTIPHPEHQLAVGSVQKFLFDYTARHPEAEVDYIHGEDSLLSLVRERNAVGFLFEGMRKDELFRSVLYDGALPRKTFSMGHAQDKRYYLECRKIK